MFGSAAVLLVPSVCMGPQGAPPPHIDGLAPSAVQRGTKARVEITGARLDRTQRVTFDDVTGLQVLVHRRQADRIWMELDVAADVSVGARELRLITPDGTSNAVSIHVGDLPVVREIEPDTSSGEGQSIRTPAMVCGRIRTSHAQRV